MKMMLKVLSLGVALAAIAPFASATPITGGINIIGSDAFTSSTITFGTSMVLNGTINGSALAFLTPVNFVSGPLTYTPGGSFNPSIFIASTNTPSGLLSFYITSETPIYVANNGAGFTTLELKGSGVFKEAGYDDTIVSYDLTTQEVIGSNTASITSFSASSAVAATPEPSSLMLLGTGLLTAVGVARRKLKA